MIEPISYAQAYHTCDLSMFSFETTETLDPLSKIIGQDRALDALEFGAEITHEGFNLFAMGPTGSGKHSVIMTYLESKAGEEAVPSDWCYVNNFSDARKPIAIKMAPGEGKRFQHDMHEIIDVLKTAIPAIFESNEYRNAREMINQKYIALQEGIFISLQKEAEKRNISMKNSYASKVTFAPIVDGKTLVPEEFEQLDEDKKDEINDKMTEFEAIVKKGLREVSQLNRSMQQEFKKLESETTAHTVDSLIDDLREKYSESEKITAYLDALQADVIEHVKDFLVKPDEAGMNPFMSAYGTPSFSRYDVNLFIDHETLATAPVIFEDNPNYQNLIGRIEHASQIGTLVTDFRMVKPGAMHRSNGGYLVLDARKLLMQPFAWEELKRVLRSKEIRIESLAQQYSLVSTVTLEPEAIPADIKVVLIGERMLYYLLYHYDPDFKELFKVVADFEEEMERSDENMQLYAQMIGTIAEKEKILPLTKAAVGRVIEHSMRDAGDARKLSTHLHNLSDLLKEADYRSRKTQKSTIDNDAIEMSLHAQEEREKRLQSKIYEQIEDGTLMIDVTGSRVGQVNGLSVLSLGGYRFGMPSRITARTRVGKGEVVNIERSVELSGPIHSKGVMILSAYLGAHYAPELPFSLSASLVFEQSYGMVEGDSASSAELYALLSSLADLPIKQNLAVTGSVNQFGQVQAIGGVNEKIEGFFDVSRRIDPEGKHGVLIPESNVKHLMLKNEVVEAMKAGTFMLYPIRTIDEGIAVLTGEEAGLPDEDNHYGEETINGKVVAKLNHFSKKLQEFSRKQGSPKSDEN